MRDDLCLFLTCFGVRGFQRIPHSILTVALNGMMCPSGSAVQWLLGCCSSDTFNQQKEEEEEDAKKADAPLRIVVIAHATRSHEKKRWRSSWPMPTVDSFQLPFAAGRDWLAAELHVREAPLTWYVRIVAHVGHDDVGAEATPVIPIPVVPQQSSPLSLRCQFYRMKSPSLLI
jgi:hypothetical protein